MAACSLSGLDRGPSEGHMTPATVWVPLIRPQGRLSSSRFGGQRRSCDLRSLLPPYSLRIVGLWFLRSFIKGGHVFTGPIATSPGSPGTKKTQLF